MLSLHRLRASHRAVQADFNAKSDASASHPKEDAHVPHDEHAKAVNEAASDNQIPARLFGTECLEDTETTEPTTADPAQQEAASHSDKPSRSVILKHVWDPLAPQTNATRFFSELEEDMRVECSKHGAVEHVRRHCHLNQPLAVP